MFELWVFKMSGFHKEPVDNTHNHQTFVDCMVSYLTKNCIRATGQKRVTKETPLLVHTPSLDEKRDFQRIQVSF